MYAIFLDIETTGLNPFQHRPIDLAYLIYDIRKERRLAKYQQIIWQPKEVWEQGDPVSIEINGYEYRDLEKGRKVEDISREIVGHFKEIGIQRGKAFFLCQNPAFDRAFFDQIVPVYTQEALNWPYHWLDLASMYWAFLLKEANGDHGVLPDSINLSKNAIGKQFGIEKEAEPHRAMNGVEHLFRCYQAVTERL